MAFILPTPRRTQTATRYDTLTYMDVLKNDLQVMDQAAISLTRENQIPIVVFPIGEKGGLAGALTGNGKFTIIRD